MPESRTHHGHERDGRSEYPTFYFGETMSNQIIVNIKMTPAGAELVLNALNQLPRGQVEALFQDILGQYQAEVKRLQGEAQQQEESVLQ